MSTSAATASTGPARRSYRACLNCRRHKTKCDLGDVNAPQSPPCSKCKRTRTECVFSAGRRGGRSNIDGANKKRKHEQDQEHEHDQEDEQGGRQQDHQGGKQTRRSVGLTADLYDGQEDQDEIEEDEADDQDRRRVSQTGNPGSAPDNRLDSSHSRTYQSNGSSRNLPTSSVSHGNTSSHTVDVHGHHSGRDHGRERAELVNGQHHQPHVQSHTQPYHTLSLSPGRIDHPGFGNQPSTHRHDSDRQTSHGQQVSNIFNTLNRSGSSGQAGARAGQQTQPHQHVRPATMNPLMGPNVNPTGQSGGGTVGYLETLFHEQTGMDIELDLDRTISPRDLEGQSSSHSLSVHPHAHGQGSASSGLKRAGQVRGAGPMLGTASPGQEAHHVGGAAGTARSGNVTVDVAGYGDLFGSLEGNHEMELELDMDGRQMQHQMQPAESQQYLQNQIGFAVPSSLQSGPSGLSLGVPVEVGTRQHHFDGSGAVPMEITDPIGSTTWNEEAFRQQNPDLFEAYGQAQAVHQQPLQPTVESGEMIQHEPSTSLQSKRRRFRANTTSDTGAGESIGGKTKASSGSGMTATGATVSDPRSFVINTGMHNESDALQILAMAATSTKKKQDRPGKRSRSHSQTSHAGSSVLAYRRPGGAGDRRGTEQSRDRGGSDRDKTARSNDGSHRREDGQEGDEEDNEAGDGEGLTTRDDSAQLLSPSIGTDFQVDASARAPGSSGNHGKRLSGKVSFTASGERAGKNQSKTPAAKPSLLSFPLVAKGIMDPEQVCLFGNMFFSKHHYVFVGRISTRSITIPVSLSSLCYAHSR